MSIEGFVGQTEEDDRKSCDDVCHREISICRLGEIVELLRKADGMMPREKQTERFGL
jgi:hypothetical protein